MNTFWDSKYSVDHYVYGKNPNAFFKSVIDTLPVGRILIPAAGEGRDAVYAASLEWDVTAFDQSTVGKQKAMNFAEERQVSIRYDVVNAFDFRLAKGSYDAIALIYFHLPSTDREQFHSSIISALSPNGIIILEAFHPRQINNTSGGPSDPTMLMTAESLHNEFAGLTVIECSEHQIVLDEGPGHSGIADVVRFVGKKK
ncbi:MAG: class I SAM-dependent methyltransferase [Bacteroidota bacterium]